MDDSTVKIITLSIACYGVIQVWLISLYKRFFKTPKIEIYLNENAEVGFGGNGANISLSGVARSTNKDIFVEKVFVNVTRLKNNSLYKFNWFIFRPPVMFSNNENAMPAEIPSGFIISPSAPYRFFIFFIDSTNQVDISEISRRFEDHWLEFLKGFPVSHPSKEIQADLDLLKKSKVEEFKKTQIAVDTYGKLKRLCYWESGDYSANIKVKLSHTKKEYLREFRFSLSEEQCERLSLNSVSIMEEPITAFTGELKPNYRIVKLKIASD